MNKEIEKALEEQFPKGSFERGGALVLHTVAQIELEKAIKIERERCAKKVEKEIDNIILLNKTFQTDDWYWYLKLRDSEKEEFNADGVRTLRKLVKIIRHKNTDDIETRKEKMTAIFEERFPHFLPASRYNNGIVLRENEIGMMYNCSIIFNPKYVDAPKIKKV